MPSALQSTVETAVLRTALGLPERVQRALQALFRAAGLAAATHGVLISALKVWRDVANGKRVAGVQEVSWLMLKELGGQRAEGDLAALVKSIHLEALRDNARGHALAIAAA